MKAKMAAGEKMPEKKKEKKAAPEAKPAKSAELQLNGPEPVTFKDHKGIS